MALAFWDNFSTSRRRAQVLTLRGEGRASLKWFAFASQMAEQALSTALYRPCRSGRLVKCCLLE